MKYESVNPIRILKGFRNERKLSEAVVLAAQIECTVTLYGRNGDKG